ncbi:MAG: 2-amino-4-hydroxy-6-hydroxymethyldihydropteridine diphosphokinase [Chloroflexi bacterium]|nr:2-amino-4-hydroxy-6-hydroxymethyldihydropteridine diphosphokinase [Chloroflexota bacterium]MDK1045324.1 2-amino-4-hydroxy-6-hydroxymethyldihydropteridine diphosphokinase [Anaerolineales bacterium]MCH8877091.1 2-amino-4-hydroxy-6-hydroxymethyldihydropteridine diphosphokinase [Chloroflexota bacterium]MCI0773582.1 2-amino-4-hydroxy-6-hydroxymethyldihydropteridine diphosphokinase [Chloroflexota bacterium]MCI0805944.1 2-amino-4-hydroxy-6-hydroxymethyldihydropteridine diphosphokinase [Chloroflexot
MNARPTEPAFIALGSNIQPEIHLPEAISQLLSLGHIQAISRAYQSRPVGGRKQPDYLNAAVLIRVPEEPGHVRTQLQEIETALGRVRTEDKYASRTIDLDLVLFGDRVDPEFPLPDPELLTREHLAVPLAEIAPDFCHPITGEALETIAARLRSGGLQPHVNVSQRMTDLLSAEVNGESGE